MIPFVSSCGNYFILVATHYVSMCAKDVTFTNNEAKVLLCSRRRMFSPNLVLLVRLLELGDLIFSINHFGPCLLDIGSNIRWHPHTILKAIGC